MDRETLLYRPEAAAELLGIGRSKLFEEMAAGRLHSVTIGRSRRIPRAELERYVAALVAGTDTTAASAG
jgi:excisionase family DNA binding protein